MGVTAFDCETHPIQPGLLAPPLVCVSWANDRGESGLLDKTDGLAFIRKLLESDETIVGHNIAYDMAVICAADPSLVPLVFKAYRDGRVRDTKTRQQLIDIQSGLTRTNGRILVWRGVEWQPQKLHLAELEQLYLNIDRSADKEGEDSWRLRYGELDGIPISQWPPEAAKYPVDDAVGTLRVFQAQGPEQLPDEVRQVRKAWGLHLISVWGMRTNPEAVAALEAEARERFNEVQQKLYEAGLLRLEPLTKAERDEGRQPDGFLPGRVYKSKPPDPPKPAKYVRNTDLIRERVRAALEAKGLPVPLTPTEEVKTDAETLEQTGDELLMELGENGPIGTVLRTFVPTLKRGTAVPINTRYNSLLETGRVSSSDPNLNNIPRSFWSQEQLEIFKGDIKTALARGDYDQAERTFKLMCMGVRECFEPRPGYVFCSVDYDCAELRALAQCCLWIPRVGFSKMAEFFQANPNGDPHLMLAATILGISYDEAKARKKEKFIKHIRQGCKAVNFGFPGGLGIEKFQTLARKNYGVEFSADEARERKKQWFATWPEMERYLAYISARVQLDNPTVEQLCPPEFRPHRKRGNVSYCDGANGFFQGLVADITGEATWLAAEESLANPESPLYGSRLVAHMYDELIAEVPIEFAHEAGFRLRDLMIETAARWCPDVPFTAMPALMTRWTKGAETVFDADDRLIPWEPKMSDL